MTHPRHILAAYGLSPRQSLGQNFLSDPNILAQIAAAAAVAPGDVVLEIGPGLGHLTLVLADLGARVVAVELDDRLIPILRDRLAGREGVRLVHGDILEQDLGELMGATGYKVVANVPYYITGAILRHLLERAPRPERIALTVQKEVAERLTARPGDMSLLAVSVQYFGAVSQAATLKAGAFWPRPDVDSAVVAIDLRPRPAPAPAQVDTFFRLVRVGFAQKRKQLQKNLRVLGFDRARLAAALAAAGIDGRRRAESLSIAEWEGLQAALFSGDDQVSSGAAVPDAG